MAGVSLVQSPGRRDHGARGDAAADPQVIPGGLQRHVRGQFRGRLGDRAAGLEGGEQHPGAAAVGGDDDALEEQGRQAAPHLRGQR